MSGASGRYVWFELMTTDVAGAKAFYAEVLGWKTTQWPGGDYEMWTTGGQPLGGLMVLPDDARKAGAPPNWLGYVGTESVDDHVARATLLGAKVFVPPTDIPGAGRFAVLADPQGAPFAVYQSGEGPPDTKSLGRFAWAELNTNDWKAAWKFYSELMGWKPTTSMDMGPELGEYFMFGVDAKESMGGMSNAATMMKAPPHWLYYVNVKSADETVKTIQKAGGKVLNGPMDIPGGGRIAQCMDPQGAAFAIVSSP